MKKPIYSFLMLLSVSLSVMGQEVTPEVIAASGDAFKTAGSQVSWTLGEVVTATHKAGSSVITQGFQQPGLVVEVGYTDPLVKLSIDVYPVPATGFVTVSFQEMTEPLTVALYNMNGALLQSQPVNSSKIQFNLTGLPAAEYIIRILAAENTLIRSYTIIKQY